MKDVEVTRMLYQDSMAFNEGVKVGKKEMIEKAYQWLSSNAKDYVATYFDEGVLQDKLLLKHFRKAMEE